MKNRVAYRTKLIIFILLAVILIFFVGLYNSLSSRFLFKETQGLLETSYQITTLYEQVDATQKELENYLSTRSSDSLQKFYEKGNEAVTSNEALRQNAMYTVRGVKIKNFCNMVDHYLKGADQTVIDKRNNNTELYIAGYEQVVKEYENLNRYSQQILSEDLSANSVWYSKLHTNIEINSAINYTLLLVTLVLIIVGTFLFSYQITRPISKLAEYAKDISGGRFDIEIGEDKSSKEMSLLFWAFRDMAANIKKHVEELREKRKLEQKLSEVQINSLKMETSLREAELHALQYQMNPHFIFNTINIGAKLAMLQGDQVTCDYLENTAAVFRYNLKSQPVVPLQAEIQNVQSYMSLLKTRFGDMLRFEMDLPENKRVLQCKMPSLTLQPLVENAYIHGVSQLEQGGDIRLTVTDKGDTVNVTITNTGPPIPEKKIKKILAGRQQGTDQNTQKGHTTNIGIDNVLHRLRLYYKREQVMNIICGGGRTSVIIMLPVNHNIGENHV